MSKKNEISRRKFLIGGASVLGGAALICAGGTALVRPRAEISFHDSSCGHASSADGKVLIAYASEAGSTSEIAAAMGQVMCQAGAVVDVRPVQAVSDLTPYRAVVVGSAIHSSAWLPEAAAFVATHRETLREVPVAYFLSCLTLAVADTDKTRRQVAAYLDPVRQQIPEIQPIDTGLFAGVLDFSKLPYPNVYRLVWPFTAGGEATEGDYRDWQAIRAWAGGLSRTMLDA
ncbi:flavodoxin domain-containing protein [Chloroflexota bacterium]